MPRRSRYAVRKGRGMRRSPVDYSSIRVSRRNFHRLLRLKKFIDLSTMNDVVSLLIDCYYRSWRGTGRRSSETAQQSSGEAEGTRLVKCPYCGYQFQGDRAAERFQCPNCRGTFNLKILESGGGREQ